VTTEQQPISRHENDGTHPKEKRKQDQKQN